MRFKQIFMVMAFAAFALVACRQEAPADTAALHIELDTSASSMAVGETTLFIIVKDANDAPVNNARIAVRGDMNHAGMIPVLRDVEGGQDGHYEVPFEWTMGGDWIVEITATLPNGEASTAGFDLSVTSDGTDEDHSQHEDHDEHNEHSDPDEHEDQSDDAEAEG